MSMPSRYWAGVIGLVVALFAATVWYGRSAPEPAPLDVGISSSTVTGVVAVHVAGEVLSPGLVQIAAGGRVADAVAGAGGSTRHADLSGINLAAPVRDGDQIVIPGLDSGQATAAGVVADGRIRINLASPTELENLPGVGPVLAARIASYRDENGSFAVVEDLLDVPGIGEGKLAGLRDAVALP